MEELVCSIGELKKPDFSLVELEKPDFSLREFEKPAFSLGKIKLPARANARQTEKASVLSKDLK